MSDIPLRLAVVTASTRTGRFGGTAGRGFVRAAQPYPA